jgi:hypothetical protein
MPMLYGEGVHAFIRLQEEIIKKSTDHSIFAWASGFPSTRHYVGGLLADCPATFANTKSVIRDVSKTTLPFEMTNRGIHLHLPIYEESFGILDCQDSSQPGYNLAIKLTKSPSSSDSFEFNPYHGTVKVAIEEQKNLPIHSIYVAQRSTPMPLTPSFSFRNTELLFELRFPLSGYILRGFSPTTWSTVSRPGGRFAISDSGTILTTRSKQRGALIFTDRAQNTFAIILTVDDSVDSFKDTHGVIFDARPISSKEDIHSAMFTARVDEDKRRRSAEPCSDRVWSVVDEEGGCITIGARRAIVSGKRSIILTIKDELLLDIES